MLENGTDGIASMMPRNGNAPMLGYEGPEPTRIAPIGVVTFEIHHRQLGAFRSHMRRHAAGDR